MSDLVINQKHRPDISKPQWDQRTYYGRVRHFFTLTNPLTLFSSEARQERCRQIVVDYKHGIISPTLTVSELWKAKTLYDSTFHPDSGEKMFFLGRMSAQMPGNMLINGMLLSLYRTFPGVVFSHWINQSFNAVVNYTNRSGNSKASNERLLLSYLCATGGAMSGALALNAMVKNKNSVAARLVPFAAVALANCINIPMIRSNEVTEGMELRDENGELVGRSRQMAILSIAQVTLSRIGMAMPDMVMTPIIMNRITRTMYYRTRPWMKYSEYPIQTMLAGMALFFTTPMCCALFPQKTAVEVTKLEASVQKEIFSRADAPEVKAEITRILNLFSKFVYDRLEPSYMRFSETDPDFQHCSL
ncbi:CRE-SFXN-1.2 protein [Caenorhabditis remanei]|uniref:Sidoreflexin n=1 Tax=Caenorhabditis remanei TaxID=31234 RepID=E3NI83_CAERE|nr:CRE-SFXN-1.2 protein [Caenorhabditis remanei]